MERYGYKTSESLRSKFDEDAANYDRFRPRYCDALFSAVIAYAKLGRTKTAVESSSPIAWAGRMAVEIGCGTGQATEPFLKTGAKVIAVEFGENLAAFARGKFKDYPNFSVENISFEDVSVPTGSVDLVYAATSFHWIPEELAFQKAKKMLRPGGALALFWNHPFLGRKDNPVHAAIQAVYDRFGMRGGAERPEVDTARYEEIAAMIERHGFIDVEVSLFHSERQFTADEYIGLLNTYSDHRRLEQTAKKTFESEIKEAIDKNGGTLTVYDTIDLYLARKP